MNDLKQHLFEQLDRLWPASHTRGVIAVSGGSDSLALMFLAKDWAMARHRRLDVVTVDHQLRPESASEAKFVANLAARLNLFHKTMAWEASCTQGNLMSAAREGRYALLAQAAAGAPILLGHTLDDQAETFMMRLARGSGVDGLAGMAERRQLDTPSGNVDLIRPLLQVTRAQLQAYLTELGQDWVNDPSNDKSEYDRIKIRQALPLLAELGLDAQRLVQTARAMASSKEALCLRMQEAAQHCLLEDMAPDVMLDPMALSDWDRDTQLRLLGRLIRYVSGAPYAPRRSALERALEYLHTGRSYAVGHAILWQNPQALHRHVFICREPAKICDIFPRNLGEIWDHRWRVTQHIPQDAQFALLTPKILQSIETKGVWPAPLRQTRPALIRGEDVLWHSFGPRADGDILVPVRGSVKEFLSSD